MNQQGEQKSVRLVARRPRQSNQLSELKVGMMECAIIQLDHQLAAAVRPGHVRLPGIGILIRAGVIRETT